MEDDGFVVHEMSAELEAADAVIIGEDEGEDAAREERSRVYRSQEYQEAAGEDDSDGGDAGMWELAERLYRQLCEDGGGGSAAEAEKLYQLLQTHYSALTCQGGLTVNLSGLLKERIVYLQMLRQIEDWCEDGSPAGDERVLVDEIKEVLVEANHDFRLVGAR